MKQGKVYTKVILWIFLAAVICYFGYYIFSAIHEPLVTTTAIEYEAGAGCYTTGLVVREEVVVRARNNIATLVVAEGARIAKGQIVATGYLSEDAHDRQSELEAVNRELEQLEYACSYSGSVSDQAALDQEILLRLTNQARHVARRDMNTAADSGVALKGLVLRRMADDAADAAMEQRIAELQARQKQLQAGSADTTEVPAECSGYFSGSVDGYERVLTVELLEELTVTGFRELEPLETGAEEIGKIITGDTWYYVVVVPEDRLEYVRVGASVPVRFAAEFYDELEMKVERISEPEDGQCLLVLSCDRYMHDATMLRQQSADIVFSSYAGLRVPKEAIRVRGKQQTGVYVLESNAAVWKTVKILYDTGESYVVELDKSSTNNLWPGDEIIVKAEDALYDGKVVR